jgi:hypothetical protein
VEKKPDYKDAKVRLEKAIDDHYTVLLNKFHDAQKLEKQKRFKEARDQYKAYEQERENSPWLLTN